MPAAQLEAAIATIERPRAHLMRRERRPPRDALYDAVVERSIPDSWALELRARAALRRLDGNAKLLTQTLALFDRFLKGTPHEADSADVARRAVAMSGRTSAALARPWLLTRVRYEDGHHVDAALEEGRGALLTNVHSPTMWLATYAALLRGHLHYPVCGPWIDTEPLSVRAWRHRARIEKLGGRVVVRGGGSFPILRELLRRGAGVSMTLDVPGRLTVQFMNKPARLRSGIARLGLETGAAICPRYAFFDEDGIVIRHLPPLCPAKFPDPQSLLQALATSFENVLLKRPALWFGSKDIWSSAGASRAPRVHIQPGDNS